MHATAPQLRARACRIAMPAVLLLAFPSLAQAVGGASPYPAGATRPQLRPRAFEYAHAAGSGGASAPSSSRPSTSKGSKHRHRKPAPPPPLRGNPARALAAFEAMQRQYYISGSGLYDGEPFSYLWPFSQALAATVNLANIPHLSATLQKEVREQIKERLLGLNEYLDANNSGAPEGVYLSTLPAFDGTVAPPAGPGGAKYYDDNDWVGIELVRLYELTHSAGLLGSAEGIMAFELAGWQEGPELACPGGIPFSNAAEGNERNAVTTAPAAELGTLLFRATHNLAYLAFAEKAYGWVRGCLLQPNGLYADHITRQGVVEPAEWSYNQGSMIGAAALLYEATRNSEYLTQARQTAAAALAYYTPQRLGAENSFFVAVYFRNLLYFDWLTHAPPGPAIAQAYVNYAWEHERLSDDVFVLGSPGTAELLDQAAITEIYGLLSTPPNTYF
jgi:hypothetical protein